jgi:aminoglycoside phosphotransferase (APT) family kinase protein
MQRLEGRPLLELKQAGTEAFDGSIALLVGLHESDAVPAKRRTARRIVRSVERKADRIARLGSPHAALFRELAAALVEAEPAEEVLVPSHGDFTPRNVLLGPAGMSVIDLDRVQQAPPLRDVAYFGAWCWARDVRDRRRPTWEALGRAVARYRELRPGVSLDALDFHAAAGLARIAHGQVELWRREEDVPQLARAALERLR